MKQLIIIATTVFIFSSCERETRIAIPPQTPKLVLESRQAQNVPPETWISRTRGVTDPLPQGGQTDPYLVKNAVVLLFEDGVFKDTLRFNNNTHRYKSTLSNVLAGKTYKIVVSAPN